MAKLIYSTITSLDGYVADKEGNFDWAAPDEEVHTFVNDLEREVGTYLYGHRMYEVMRYWESAHALTDQPPVEQDFAQIWRAAEKVVYSKTLEMVSSARTRIERDFDAETIRRMKGQAERDISVGGSDLAAQALKAGLVDECHLFVAPIVVGGGKRSLPQMSAWSSNCSTNDVSRAAWFTFTTAQGRKETATPDGPVQRPKSILCKFARTRLAPERLGGTSEG
jgi:dihydrofolate reductase